MKAHQLRLAAVLIGAIGVAVGLSVETKELAAGRARARGRRSNLS